MEKIKLDIQKYASTGCSVSNDVTITQDIINNCSTITITATLTTGSSSFNYGGAYMQPTISNQPVVGNQTSSQTLSKKKYNIGTNSSKTGEWTFTVYHKDDGTCNNLTIAVKWYISDNSNGTVYKSNGYTPATIARASSITATDGELNTSNSVSITITRKNNTFTHTLRYVCGSASGWIKDSNNKVATSATWTPPLSLANQNQSGNTVSCTIYCQTYNGSTEIGSEKSTTISLTIPTLNPTASLSSISDSTSYKNTYGVFIQNKSKISATLSGTAQYSTINTYNWEIRQTNSSGSVLASGSSTSISYTPTTSGTLYIKGTVKDKRGASNSTSTTVSITAYNTPKCNLSVSRTGATTASYTMSGSGSPISVTNKTPNVVRYLLKRNNTTTIRDTSDGTSYPGTDSGITADNSYTYTLTASDTISGTTDTKTVSISTTFTLMNFSATGYGLSIGKASEVTGTTKLFEVDIPAQFNSTVTGTISNATTATKLGTSTVGGTNRPIYLNGGTATQCNTPASENWWRGVPYLQSNGVLEIGRYIDFHGTNATTADFTTRLDAGNRTTARTLTLPDKTGTLACTSDIPTLPSVTSGTGAVTRDSGATLNTAEWVKYGKICQLHIKVTSTSSTSAGNNLFVGTVGSSYLPKISSNGVSYNGSIAIIGYIDMDSASDTYKKLILRVVGGTLATNKTANIGFTYIQS